MMHAQVLVEPSRQTYTHFNSSICLCFTIKRIVSYSQSTTSNNYVSGIYYWKEISNIDGKRSFHRYFYIVPYVWWISELSTLIVVYPYEWCECNILSQLYSAELFWLCDTVEKVFALLRKYEVVFNVT